MSNINGSSALDKVLSDYAHKEPEKKNNEMGRGEFLELLVAQLENQDPMSPQENGEFVAQLAQFSSLEEAQKLTTGFDNFSKNFQSTQHLQATSLVGRPVHVEAESAMLGEQGAISVLADIPASTDKATLNIYNQAGEKVDSYELGPQQAGRQEFIWAGFNSAEERFPAGSYSFDVNVTQDGANVSAPLYLSANVNSVTIEPSGSLTLNLAGVGPTPLSEVVQIN